MKLNIFSLLALAVGFTALASCDTDTEAIEVQKPLTYDEQYYKDLRDYKKTDHEICYVYYQNWRPLEGVSGYKDPASWGERFRGLPDSIDIVNTWLGIPTKEEHPVAYADMKYCQEKLGTRFVMHADASHYRHTVPVLDEELNPVMKLDADGKQVYDESGKPVADTIFLADNVNEDNLKYYARNAVKQVVDAEMDGMDWDYEGWSSDRLLVVIKECYKYFGPEGKWPEKLIIIDYFNSSPSSSMNPYCDYLIKQAYSGQGAGAAFVSGWDTKKQVMCEAIHQNPNGGQVENYARWQKGNKGGAGGFSIRFNYNQDRLGVPYGALRRAIQIMNPAMKK